MFDNNVYSQIASVVSASPELRNPLRFLSEIKAKEDNIREIQYEIKSLYLECESKDAVLDLKDTNNMLDNITNGSFEEFLKKKPHIFEFECSLSETRKAVQTVALDVLKSKEEELLRISKLEFLKSENDSLFGNVKKHVDKSNCEILEKCHNTIDRFKTNFKVLDVHESLIKNGKRDLEFEELMKKCALDIAEIKQLIEAKKAITNLDCEKEVEPTHDAVSSQLANDISGLLKEVESANYTAEDC